MPKLVSGGDLKSPDLNDHVSSILTSGTDNSIFLKAFKMNCSSQTITQQFAKIELATVNFQGKDFTALGSIIDEQAGFVLGYIKQVGRLYQLTTWNGDVITSPKLTGTWLNRNVFGGFPVRMYAWSCVINGKKYHGRNSGVGFLIRLRSS